MPSDYIFDNYAHEVRRARGDRRWFEWMVFVDEDDTTLDKIESVEYELHRTFPNPIQIITDRNSKFALRASGWGEFTIFITVNQKDGQSVYTDYDLDLSKRWPGQD